MDIPVLRESVGFPDLARVLPALGATLRSTNDVFTVRETRERDRSQPKTAAVPNTSAVTTSTTLPFSRVLRTVA